MKSTIQSGLWKVEFGELGATLKVLQDHGVTPDHLARLRAEPDYAKRVAEFMLRGGLDASIHQKLARAVMGKDFFGVEDWSALYGVNFSQKQLRQVAEFPWGEDILNSTCPLCGKVVKDCHFAFVGLDRNPTADGIRYILSHAARIVPALGGLRVLRTWAGLRPYTPDGLPLLGPAPGVQGLYLAAGHDGSGVNHAPVSAQLVSALITGAKAPLPPDPFDPRRFGDD
ncbi:MAG: Dimethylglycine dehydrogenase [Candidatus Azambacteria bacterium GW2011_GWC2_45_7b]|uniref:Dimethylglycine dehydrogenase n=1 Tax=Candidatus Azambacteria bacterium GW2011_GWC2_45_7b TaxID=1618621 RepID=A0A837IG69_9BACT|nr:MAG: Dimethylglycine dehydrogenase [Candidatus Azambacteria bacterium GW2011_GWC2_45_7b]